jgi:hypothetical protein
MSMNASCVQGEGYFTKLCISTCFPYIPSVLLFLFHSIFLASNDLPMHCKSSGVYFVLY